MKREKEMKDNDGRLDGFGGDAEEEDLSRWKSTVLYRGTTCGGRGSESMEIGYRLIPASAKIVDDPMTNLAQWWTNDEASLSCPTGTCYTLY